MLLPFPFIWDINGKKLLIFKTLLCNSGYFATGCHNSTSNCKTFGFDRWYFQARVRSTIIFWLYLVCILLHSQHIMYCDFLFMRFMNLVIYRSHTAELPVYNTWWGLTKNFARLMFCSSCVCIKTIVFV